MPKKRKTVSGRAVPVPTPAQQTLAPPLTTPSFNQDPFAVLVDLCTDLILSELSTEDIVNCAGVNRQWRGVVYNLLQRTTVIRMHLPQSWELLKDTSDEERFNGFLRQACLHGAIKTGKAAWVRKFENAEGFAVAGNYMVWHSVSGRSFTWQDISGFGETATASIQENLLFWPKDNKRTHAVDKVLVNEGGYTFVRSRVGLGPYSYPPSNNYFPVNKAIQRDTVFRLPSTEGLWMRERRCIDLALGKIDILEPILIGKSRVYYVIIKDRTESSSLLQPSLLQAHDLITGECLYQKVLHADFFGRHGISDGFRLITLGDKEYLMNFLARRPGSGHFLTSSDYIFTIIDGETGECLQTIQQGKLAEKYRVATLHVMPKPGSSTTFAICSKTLVYSSGSMAIIQIFSKKRDGIFTRDEIITVAVPFKLDHPDPRARPYYYGLWWTWVINPFTLQIFQMRWLGMTSGILTRFTEDETHSEGVPLSWFHRATSLRSGHLAGEKLENFAPVVSHYTVGSMPFVTLPSQVGAKHSKNGRRLCPVKADSNGGAYVGEREMFILNSGQRVLFRDYGSNSQGPQNLYIFDFGAGW